MKHLILLLSVFLGLTFTISAQNISPVMSNSQYSADEIYFRFSIKDKNELVSITRMISIDNVKGNVVTAYATPEQFRKFSALGYSVTRLPNPGIMTGDNAIMTGPKAPGSGVIWNFYPTYDQYVQYMNDFASNNPSLCKLINFGTTTQGRQLLMVKISDSVDYSRGKPRVLLTSSIHGDETVGYVLMLHMIDSLLSGYGTNPRITNLVDNFEIYINPLANPDGTYHGGNNTVYGSTRYNANGVDLNRNFPNMAGGDHPDGYAWQPETIAFMAIADSDFVMSMNFHGGSEVYNYPWDTWPRLHADDNWWKFTGREYADTVHKYSTSGYFTDENNGITNGYAWYCVYGGRQDYTTYYKFGREVTLEISSTKNLPSSQVYKLIYYWNYNKRSILDYIEEAGYGINGQITDTVSGKPLNAKVFIFGHDKDNSFVYSHLPSGWYFRPIFDGTYDLTYSCDGYNTKLVNGISTVKYQTNRQNVQLVPLNFGINGKTKSGKLNILPNPSSIQCLIVLPESVATGYSLDVYNVLGNKVTSMEGTENPEYPFINLDISGYAKGFYLIRFMNAAGNIWEGKLLKE